MTSRSLSFLVSFVLFGQPLFAASQVQLACDMNIDQMKSFRVEEDLHTAVLTLTVELTDGRTEVRGLAESEYRQIKRIPLLLTIQKNVTYRLAEQKIDQYMTEFVLLREEGNRSSTHSIDCH